MKVAKHCCGECPFRKTSLRGWLGPHTIEDVLGMQQAEIPFACHSVLTEGPTDGFLDIVDGTIAVCRGFIASANKSCKMFGSNSVFGKGLRELQLEIKDPEKLQILDRNEFRQHHSRPIG